MKVINYILGFIIMIPLTPLFLVMFISIAVRVLFSWLEAGCAYCINKSIEYTANQIEKLDSDNL